MFLGDLTKKRIVRAASCFLLTVLICTVISTGAVSGDLDGVGGLRIKMKDQGGDGIGNSTYGGDGGLAQGSVASTARDDTGNTGRLPLTICGYVMPPSWFLMLTQLCLYRGR
jgi:hypothetical protein